MKPWDNEILTQEEISQAIEEGKRKKYFWNKNASYWEQKEREAIEAKKAADELARLRRKLVKDEKELI